MKFSDAHFLFWLWVLVPVALVMIYGIRFRRQILARFAHPDRYPDLIPGFTARPHWVRFALVLGGLGLSILALAGPLAGFHWEKTRTRGVDIMIALDCSRSMLATDVLPSRLARAKREIIDLTRLMHSDRAGLVAFSGQAVLQCPLTLDHAAFQIFLDVLEPGFLPVGGTDLAAALTTCMKGFDAKADTDKAIILITDGEDTTERGKSALDEVVQNLTKEKVKIFAIGVGDLSGAPVPDERGGFKRDAGGEIILSKVDEKGLQEMAAATGGRYVRSVAGDMDLDQIYNQDILNTMERKSLVAGKKKVWENRFQWLLLPAILLFLAELFIRPGKNGRSPAPKGIRLLAVLLVFGLVVTASPARAGLFSSPVKEGMAAFEKKDYQAAKKRFIDAQLANPDDPRLYYNIGAAAYGAGEFALARDNFTQALASADPGLRQKALFNLANTQYRLGDLAGAIKTYETLLKEFPEDKDAQENLAFVKEKLKEQNQPKAPRKEDTAQDPSPDQDKNQDKNQGLDKSQDQDQGPGNDQEKNSPQGTDNPQGDQPRNDGAMNSDPKEKGGQNNDQNQGRPNGPDPDQGKSPDSQTPEQGQGSSQDPNGQADQTQGQSARAGSPTPGQPLSREEAQMLESRLNRLSDTPGRALMPAEGGRRVERDW